MVSIELKTLARRWPLVARHPRWVVTYARGGLPELYRRLVAESVEVMRHTPPPSTALEATTRGPYSPIGKLGGVQEYLYNVVRWLRPETVVETGVHRGISTAFMLAALSDVGSGRLFSIDLANREFRLENGRVARTQLPQGEGTGFVVPEHLRTAWTLIQGDTATELGPLLSRLKRIDMFLHDSEHTYARMVSEYALARTHLRPGGVLASDDVSWNSAFAEFVRANPSSWSTVIQNQLGIVVLA